MELGSTGGARSCFLGSTAVYPPPWAVVNARPARGGLRLLWFHRFSNAAFCALFCSRVCTLERPYWVFGACFANSLNWAWVQLHIFLLILTSTHKNMQSKPKKGKTKRNRRNIYINCKIMQIILKIKPKLFKFPCIYDTYQTPHA